MKKYIYTFLIFLIALNVQAQKKQTAQKPATTQKQAAPAVKKNAKHQKKHKLSTRLVKKKSYFNAIDHLVQLTKEDSTNREYLNHLAETYLLVRDYKHAEETFIKVVMLDGDNTTKALYNLGVSLKHNSKYLEAEDAFQDFVDSKYKEAKGEKTKTFARNEVGSCRWAYENMISTGSVSIQNAGDTINANYSDFAPKWKSKDTLMYSSLQADSVLTVEHGEAHFYHVKMYQSSHNSGLWSTPVEVKGVNTTYENNANGFVSADGKSFYFTRCEPNKQHEMICEIYVAPIENGQIGKGRRLPEPVNIPGYTSTQPYILTQQQGKNKTEVIYFSSNRPGGKGGMDIWVVSKGKGGIWGKAQSLGTEVNTLGDEITPYYDEARGVFNFSSNFHYGFGGYDIIEVSYKSNKFGKAANLGWDYNSGADDTYFLKYNKTDGFLVSNRIGGFNLKSETCCDDIYLHSAVDPVKLRISIVGLMQKQMFDSVEVRKTVSKDGKPKKISMKQAVAVRVQSGAMDVVTLDGDTINAMIYKKLKDNKKVAIVQGYLSKEVTDTVQSFNFFLEPNQEYIVRTRRKGVLLEELFETYDTIRFTSKLQDTTLRVRYNLLKKEENITVLRIEPLRKQIEHIDTILVHIGDTTRNLNAQLAQQKVDEVTETDPAKAKGQLADKQSDAKSSGLNQNSLTDANAASTAGKTVNDPVKTVSGTNKSQLTETIAKGSAAATATTVVTVKDPKKLNGAKSKQLTETKVDSAYLARQQAFLDSMKRQREIQQLVAQKRKQAKDSTILALTQSKVTLYFEYKEKGFHTDPQVQELLNHLHNHKELAVEVGAFTDSIGGEAYNKKLSQARAQAIVNYLVSQGINKKRIQAKGYGQENPVAPNVNEDGSDNPEGRSKNRRAEIKLVKM